MGTLEILFIIIMSVYILRNYSYVSGVTFTDCHGIYILVHKQLLKYHWWELPPVSFLLQQNFCFDKHVFVMTKHIFCHNKSMLVATKLLSWQTYLCHDKTGCDRYLCRDKHNFVVTKVLLWQAYFCQDKSMLVVTKLLSWQTVMKNICHDKHNFVMAKVLLWQAYFYRDKRCVLSQQTYVCATKHLP